jgi:hypothetical protein
MHIWIVNARFRKKIVSWQHQYVHSTKHKKMEKVRNHSFILTKVNNGMVKTLATEGNIVTIHANHQITPNTHIFAYRFDQNKIYKNWYIITNAKT